jgi:peptidoglycan hydrolase CwlO-like protein
MTNKIVLGALLLLPSVLAADDAKPLPKDTQISLLKAQRQIQQLQIQIADLQRQYEQATNNIKQLQAQMETDCNAAAKEAKVDLSKFTCNLDTLTFTPKPPVTPAPANPK